MAHIPSEDLERIEKKLETIEAKIGSKWALPIIVALVSGVIGLATVVVQVRLERASSEERLKLETKLQQDAALLSANQIFYNDAVTLVGRIDYLFKQASYDAKFNKDSLNNLCIDCFALINKHRPHYGEEKDFIKKLKEYNDFVSEELFNPRSKTSQEREDVF